MKPIFCFVFFHIVFFVLYVLCCVFHGVFFPVIFLYVVFSHVVFFRVIYFYILLKAFQYLRHILLLYIWYIFGQALKNKVSLGVGQLGLIHYLVIFLCLFLSYLNVSRLNCLLILLLLSLVFSLHK